MRSESRDGRHESFGERLRRRRREMSQDESLPSEEPVWHSRTRILFALVVESPHACASIVRKSASAALSVEGVSHILFSDDLPPFQNTLGSDFSGEPLLAEDRVFYRGQPVALVLGTSEDVCRRAAAEIEIEYHTDSGILTLDHALARESYHGPPRECGRGDVSDGFASSAERLEGSFSIPSQRVSVPIGRGVTVRPEDEGAVTDARGVRVSAGALLPTAVRTAVAKAAEIPESEVHLEPVDVPGLTGALEMAPVRLAALATHAMRRCGCTVTLLIDSPESPLVSGDRHEAHAQFEVGFDRDGVIHALDLRLSLDGGWFEADSGVVMDRAILHADGVYAIPHLRLRSRLCQTHRITSACLPSEGAAQGCWTIEEVVQRVAEHLDLSPHEVRERNLYREADELKTTPYGQTVQAASIHRVWNQVLRRADYEARREAIAKWNRQNASYKRGIAALPVKFGVGDPRSERNAAAVIVQLLPDGSVMVRAGLVRVNDGLSHQIQEEVSHLLGVEEGAIRVILNDFDSLPRATPVTGTDASGLILRALADACKSLVKRLREVALQLFAARGQTEIELEAIRFVNGMVGPNISPTAPLDFKEVIEGAWRKRVNLIETGYHRTPNLWWDPELGGGWPFTSFTYAAAVIEIQIDAFTGEIQILRLDVAHEGSPSPNQGERDFAQLMRAHQLGAGWILCESLPDPERDDAAPPRHRGILGVADAPFEVVTDRLRPLADPTTVPGDPCAEAPLLLAVGIRDALRHALHSFGLDSDIDVDIPFPATPPKVIAVCKEIHDRIREQESGKKKTGS